jgi:hypothetical protein
MKTAGLVMKIKSITTPSSSTGWYAVFSSDGVPYKWFDEIAVWATVECTTNDDVTFTAVMGLTAEWDSAFLTTPNDCNNFVGYFTATDVALMKAGTYDASLEHD